MDSNIDQQLSIITKPDFPSPRGKKLKLLWIILALILIATAGGGTWYFMQIKEKNALAQKQKVEQDYRDKLASSAVAVAQAADIANKVCSLYSNVWKRSIDSKLPIQVNGKYAFDFNEALQYQMESLKSSGLLKSLDELKDSAENVMKQVRNPSTSNQKAYDTLFEMYSIFSQLYAQAKNPTGSLNSFNQNINKLNGDLDRVLAQFQLLVPPNVKSS